MDVEIGYGKSDITPPLGVELCGFGYYLHRKAVGVRDRLFCRAAFLSVGQEHAIFVICDLIGLTVHHTDQLREAIACRYGIGKERILIACTHTHYGPATMDLDGLGEPDDQYLNRFDDLIVEAIDQAAKDRQGATARYGAYPVSSIGYDRRNNTSLTAGHDLQALIFERETDAVCMAVYACHPVTPGGATGLISADWPGYLATRLEAQGIRPLVFQGCSGDIDPVARVMSDMDPTEELSRYATLLSEGIAQIRVNAQTLPANSVSAYELRISLPFYPSDEQAIDRMRDEAIRYSNEQEAGFDKIPNAVAFEERWAMRAKAMCQQLLDNPVLEGVPVQAIRLGDIGILGLPGEVFSGVGLHLQARHSPLMVIALSGGSVGYLPTEQAYEDPNDYACYAAPKFYQVFPFRPTLSRVIYQAADSAMKATGF